MLKNDVTGKMVMSSKKVSTKSCNLKQGTSDQKLYSSE